MRTLQRCLLALAMCAWIRAGLPAAEAVKPSFILFFIDDLGYGDIGAFGATLQKTPHLDRMAREGMKLTSFYGAPVCSPSRASLMTGCYPKRVGIPQVLFPGQPTGIHASERTLAELLKEQGYATMCIGKWHLGDQPEFLPTRHGFDHYFGIPYSNDMGPAKDGARRRIGQPNANVAPMPPIPLLRDEKVLQAVKAADQEQLTRRYTDEAVRFLRENRDRPFFLYLPHTAVHYPLYPSADFRGKSNNGPLGDWIEEMDASIGKVMDTVRELKLSERTLVFFTSDNGAPGNRKGSNGPLRGAKASTFEGGMREPTLAWWSGRIPAGTTCAATASVMDLLPTLVTLAGGKVPGERVVDGKDIWPLLSAKSQESPHEAFYFFTGQKLNAVRGGPWKLELASGKLYNLDEDIGETTDVAAKHADVVGKLTRLANKMRADLGDGQPGPGCRPSGRVVDPQPLIDREGKVRPGFAAETYKYAN